MTWPAIDLADIARHDIQCHETPQTMVHKRVDDVAGNTRPYWLVNTLFSHPAAGAASAGKAGRGAGAGAGAAGGRGAALAGGKGASVKAARPTGLQAEDWM